MTATYSTRYILPHIQSMSRSNFPFELSLGNLIDTANFYHGGESETWIGEFIKERRNRENLVRILLKINIIYLI